MDTPHPLEQALQGQEIPDPSSPTNGRVQSILPALNNNAGTVTVVKEKPWHRSLAYMRLQGVSKKQCAKEFDCSVQQVINVSAQPWFKQICVELADIHFAGDMFGMLESAAFDAVQTLNELAVGAESETVRRASASDLLDKFLKHRKPAEDKTPDNPEQELKQLDEELERLEGDEATHKLI